MSGVANRTDETAAHAQFAALGSIMDYAIIEGAQLELPTFVYLIRLARIALLEASAERGCIDALQRPPDRQMSCSSRKERRSTNDEARNRAVKSAPPSDSKGTAGIRSSSFGRQSPRHSLVNRASGTRRPTNGTSQ
jgi:hypothetical protein